MTGAAAPASFAPLEIAYHHAFLHPGAEGGWQTDWLQNVQFVLHGKLHEIYE